MPAETTEGPKAAAEAEPGPADEDVAAETLAGSAVAAPEATPDDTELAEVTVGPFATTVGLVVPAGACVSPREVMVGL